MPGQVMLLYLQVRVHMSCMSAGEMNTTAAWLQIFTAEGLGKSANASSQAVVGGAAELQLGQWVAPVRVKARTHLSTHVHTQ